MQDYSKWDEHQFARCDAHWRSALVWSPEREGEVFVHKGSYGRAGFLVESVKTGDILYVKTFDNILLPAGFFNDQSSNCAVMLTKNTERAERRGICTANVVATYVLDDGTSQQGHPSIATLVNAHLNPTVGKPDACEEWRSYAVTRTVCVSQGDLGGGVSWIVTAKGRHGLWLSEEKLFKSLTNTTPVITQRIRKALEI